MTILNVRNADLAQFAALLQERGALSEDYVTPAERLVSVNGTLVYKNQIVEITEDGVNTFPEASYQVSNVFLEGLATRLEVPVGYLKRIHAERPDIFDATVNGFIQGGEGYAADGRKFLFRTFRGEGGDQGIARALLSDTYKPIDDLDVLVAVLSGVKEAGVKIDVESCDLTERKSIVRISAPEVSALAPDLLKGYRSPFDNGAERAGGWSVENARAAAARENKGYGQGGEPVVFAGFVVTNSETGGGAFNIVPRLVVQVCRNGLTITRDAFKKVHLGSRLEEGLINWTEDTQRKNLELITAQARDAVATFLNVDYVRKVIEQLEEKASTPVVDPNAVIEKVAKSLKYTADEATGILSHFILGGQLTAAGVLGAVTSYAQTVEDADKAYDLEASAFEAFELAAAS